MLSTVVEHLVCTLRDGSDVDATAAALRGLQTLLLLPDDSTSDNAQAAVDAGAVGVLVQQLGRPDTALAAAATLGLLAFNSRAARDDAITAEALTAVAALLETGGPTVYRVSFAVWLLIVHGAEITWTAPIEAVDLMHVFPTSSIVFGVLTPMVINTFERLAFGADEVAQLARSARDGYGLERIHATRVLSRLVEEEANPEAAAAVQALLEVPTSDDGEREVWDPVAFARSVLAHFVRQQDVGSNISDVLLSRSDLLLDNGLGDDRWQPVLALDDLLCLIIEAEDVAMLPAVSTHTIPVCAKYIMSGDSVERRYAATILVNLLVRNDALRPAITGAIGIDTLVAMLHSGQREVSGLLLLAVSDSHDKCLEAVASGAVAPLVRSLRDGRLQEKNAAAATLDLLVQAVPAAQAEATSAGAVELLLQLLDVVDHDDQAEVVVALKSLVCDHVEAKDAFVSAGGAPVLVRVLSEGDEAAKEQAAKTIDVLAVDHVLAQEAFTAAGALAPLLELLHGDAFLTALYTLCVLVIDHPVNLALVAQPQVARRLVALLAAGGSNRQRRAVLHVIRIVASSAPAAQATLAAANAVQALVDALRDPAFDDPSWAALALFSLVENSPVNLAAALAARALEPLAALLARSADLDFGVCVVWALLTLLQSDVVAMPVDANAMDAFLKMFAFRDHRLTKHALVALRSLTADATKRPVLAAHLPLRVLLEVLKTISDDDKRLGMVFDDPSTSDETKQQAAMLITTLTEDDPVGRATAIDAGLVAAVVELRRGNVDSEVEGALHATLVGLIVDSRAGEDAASAAGAVDEVRAAEDDGEGRGDAISFTLRQNTMESP